MSLRTCALLVLVAVLTSPLAAQDAAKPDFVGGRSYTLNGYLSTQTAIDPNVRDDVVVAPTKSVVFHAKPADDWQSWSVSLTAAVPARAGNLVKIAEAVGWHIPVTVTGTWDARSATLSVSRIAIALDAPAPTGAGRGGPERDGSLLGVGARRR